jgi:CubicO group peptidase (beta-lactamase class C family)
MNKIRTLLVVTIISFSGLMSLTFINASAGATLQIVQGSKELESLVTSIEISKPEALYLQWTTDQQFATGGTWTVRNLTAGNKVVASGEAGPAPPIGHFARFTISANAFLQSPPPATPVKYHITIVAHDKFQQTMGLASASVVVSQVPEGPPSKPTTFGGGAVFPTVEILNYEEKVGVVPATQLHFAGADVTVRIKNSAFIFKTPSDPVWLVIKDNSQLMRQKTPVPVPALKPGTEETISVHLDAILPPATSQLPEDQQYSEWSQQNRDRCGVDLRTVMDWRGPQAQTPVNSHSETVLFPNAPICKGNQCVRTCQIARNIHATLDGSVVGYSFFVGLYPKFEAYGEARTSADSSKQSFTEFTSKTKITVASVSKMVTTIAAVRILDKHGVSLDAKIGPYLPADWNTRTSILSDYVYNLTFAQLLSQHSGIMDYGNRPVGDYDTLRKFFTQPVSKSSTTTCQPSTVERPANPINPNPGNAADRNCADLLPGLPCRCYSNYNFDIMRILLPKVAGFAEDSNQVTRPQTLANQYIKLVQENVFDLVGQKDVDCRPPGGSTNYAFAYLYPGNKEGFDWGDVSLRCGSAAWYLSIEDIARVLLSINSKDGKILSAAPGHDLFEVMRTRHLGWDVWGDGELEKNGGWSAQCDSQQNCATISTSIAIFGPVSGPRVIGVLFINSNIAGSPNGSAKSVLENAYSSAIVTK